MLVSDAKIGAVVLCIDENRNQISRENEFIGCFRAVARLPNFWHRDEKLQSDDEPRQRGQHRWYQ